MAFRLPRTADHRPPPARRRTGGGVPAGVLVSTSSAVTGYPLSRARGSNQAVATSQSSTATRTATVNSMNSACMSG